MTVKNGAGKLQTSIVMPKMPDFSEDISKLEIDCRIKTVREDKKEEEDAHSFSFSGPSELKNEETKK